MNADALLALRPVSLREAKRFVADHHRHTIPPVGWKFGVGVEAAGGELVGVGMAGRPVAREMDDGRTLEIIRVTAIDPAPKNVCSMVYGALCRAGKALGFRTAISYTLVTEDGTSLLAAGFRIEESLPERDHWLRNDGGRYQEDLFGAARRDPGAKHRWRRVLEVAR